MSVQSLRWTWGLILAATPLTVSAQPVPHSTLTPTGCCGEIHQPLAPCVGTELRPVMQTQLRPQAVTTMVNVTETQYRTEQILQSIPITTLQTVTVDEGGYQMVWVPKMVTKQTPRTTITQQVQTRTIPIQVTRQVPQTTTVMVPHQTVQFVPQAVPHAVAAPTPVITLGAPDFIGTPTPAPQKAADQTWQSVPQRKATPASKSSTPINDAAPLQRKTSAIQPSTTPTAARVWNAMSQSPARSSGTMVGLNDR